MDIINGKCIAINGKILPQSFLSIFFHEYIHLYDNFNRLKTYKDNYLNFYNRVNDAANRENQIKHYFSGNEENAIKYLLYRLFNGEDNAIIGDLFADLISYNVISYNDYKRNIKYMRSFRIYEKCKNALNIIKDVDAFSLFEFLSDNPGFFTGYTDGQKVIKNILSEDYNAVKRKFIKILEKQLEKLYSKMLKFVGRYVYMMQTYNDKLVTNIKIQ